MYHLIFIILLYYATDYNSLEPEKKTRRNPEEKPTRKRDSKYGQR